MVFVVVVGCTGATVVVVGGTNGGVTTPTWVYGYGIQGNDRSGPRLIYAEKAAAGNGTATGKAPGAAAAGNASGVPATSSAAPLWLLLPKVLNISMKELFMAGVTAKTALGGWPRPTEVPCMSFKNTQRCSPPAPGAEGVGHREGPAEQLAHVGKNIAHLEEALKIQHV